MAWIYVAQYGNIAAVWNTVMNPGVQKIWGFCLLGAKSFVSREELRPMELIAFRLSGDDQELNIGLTE